MKFQLKNEILKKEGKNVHINRIYPAHNNSDIHFLILIVAAARESKTFHSLLTFS